MKTKILIALVLLAVFTVSCHKTTIEYRELTETMQQLIPYKLGQTVNFIDSEGQNFTVTVTKDTTYWEMAPGSDSEYTLYIQRKIVRLQSDVANFDATLNMVGTSIYMKIDSPSDMWFHLRYDKKGKFYTDVRYCNTLLDCQYFRENFKINNQTYYDVVEQIMSYSKRDENGQLIGRYTRSLFYNKTYGILQIIDGDGENFLTINE